MSSDAPHLAPQPLPGHEYLFALDTAEGQLFLNRMLMSLPRRLEPAPGREPRLVRDPGCPPLPGSRTRSP